MATAARSPMNRISEYFTLRAATATANKLSQDTRSQIATSLAIGRQKAEAADALWSAGHTAEGLNLAAISFNKTVEAAVALHGTEAPAIETSPETDAEAKPDAEKSATPPKSKLAEVLKNRGVSERKLERILAAQKLLEASPLPGLNEEVSGQHSKLYEQLAYGRTQMDHALELTALTPKQLTRTLMSRVILAIGLGIAGIVLIYFIVRTPPIPDYDSSDIYDGFPASNIGDGNEDTEWLLPNQSTGWVQAAVDPPQAIQKVRLLNSHNRNYNDRATNEFRVEFYRDNAVIGTRNGNFPTLESRPDWLEIEAGFENIDAIRFVVLSFHREGGGLAELQYE